MNNPVLGQLIEDVILQESSFLKTEVTLAGDNVIQEIDLKNLRGRGNAPGEL